MQQPRFPLTVFYDGSCRVCDAEMDRYRKKAPPERICFVDISDPGFDPGAYGKSLDDFMQQLHVLDADGRFYLAVDGFRAIWQAMPGPSLFSLLGRLVQLPGVYSLAHLGYRLFAKGRKYLPKKNRTCDDGSCPLNHRK
ncbi:MAG: DUF393 domain-containing protein [Desulfuromonadales bacterium]